MNTEEFTKWLDEGAPGAAGDGDPNFEELLDQSSLGQAQAVHEDDGQRTASPRIAWRHDDDHPYLNVLLIGRVGKVDLFTISASLSPTGRTQAPYSLGNAFGYDLRDETVHLSVEGAKERAERDLIRFINALGVQFKEQQ